MKKLIICSAMIFLCVSGCSYKITQSSFNEKNEFYENVNSLCKEKKDIILIPKNSTEILANNIFIRGDSICFYDKTLNNIRRIATKEIREIKFKGTGTSILEGIVFGGLIGGFTGNITTQPHNPGFEGAVYTLGGIILGSLIGTTHALIWAPYTNFIFNNTEEK